MKIVLGMPEDGAWRVSGSRKGYWRLANTPQTNKGPGLAYWRNQGFTSLVERYRELRHSL
ncbi:RNA-directed DNA polymerase [Calderihabitans maritimus]|uniref:RNA-directed DNA polymerase n=1 Tax=Calderihabitans maritimus TaxID=1246530 RepID=A0A1Z5HT95_9FIRM|nr:RNA-directed DNA polymerase [Calderihabitans maritimus]